jgi:hypothetical protein
MRIPRRVTAATLAAVTTVALAACQGSSSATSPPPGGSPSTSPTSSASGGSKGSPGSVPSQSPLPAESNPPGDIPDTTRYVPYHSAKGGFAVKVPEGWSRQTTASSVMFTDKLNTINVQWSSASSAPTTSSARSKDVPQLKRTVPAFTLAHIIACAPSCTIPYTTGPIVDSLPLHAVVISYFANSAPNAVTGKRYRDEVDRFEFFRSGVEAVLTLSGPEGSDNKDPWRLVSESFAWK